MKEFVIQVGSNMIHSNLDECDARMAAREFAAANPGVEVLLWHRDTWAEAKEYIQKAGSVLEWDGDDDEYDEELNRWYAVQVGDDTDCGNGSEDYEEALGTALNWAESFPDEEVRIVYCTLRDNFADEVEIIQEGRCD